MELIISPLPTTSPRHACLALPASTDHAVRLTAISLRLLRPGARRFDGAGATAAGGHALPAGGGRRVGHVRAERARRGADASHAGAAAAAAHAPRDARAPRARDARHAPLGRTRRPAPLRRVHPAVWRGQLSGGYPPLNAPPLISQTSRISKSIR